MLCCYADADVGARQKKFNDEPNILIWFMLLLPGCKEMLLNVKVSKLTRGNME